MANTERIDNTTAFLMVAVSATFDLTAGGATVLVVIDGGLTSGLISISGFLIMGFWLVLKGAKFLSGDNIQKKSATFFVSLIIEAIPAINALPALTLFVVRTILMVKSEDKIKKLKALTAEETAQIPDNVKKPRGTYYDRDQEIEEGEQEPEEDREGEWEGSRETGQNEQEPSNHIAEPENVPDKSEPPLPKGSPLTPSR